MARIYKQRWSKRLPDGRTRRGKTRKWYVEYRDRDGVLQTVPGYVDKAATVQLAAQLERKAARQAVNMIDRCDDHLRRPLREHMADWHKGLLDKGVTRKHADLLKSRVKALLTGCKFEFWSDVSASTVQGWIADQRASGLSVQTCNFYLQAAKQFCRWLLKDGRAPQNPLAYLEAGNVKTDRRHDRRAFSAEDLQRVLEAARMGPDRSGMTGVDRAMLYRVAVETGLRAGELRSLTVGSFKLAGDSPTVTVAAAYSKHRREDVLPIRPDLAAVLREHFAGKSSVAVAFRMPEPSAVSRMLRADLGAARTAWIEQARGNPAEHERRKDSDFLSYADAAGRKADFHALRHTFISNLARGGVHPKIAQQLARHSTITLTMDRYSHTVMGELQDALRALPGLDSVPPEITRQRAARRGGGASCETDLPHERTHDPASESALTAALTGAASGPVRPASVTDGESGEKVRLLSRGNRRENLENTGVSDDLDRHAPTDDDEERRGGDSNPRYRFYPVQRFSKPSLSATQPPLLSAGSITGALHARGDEGCKNALLVRNATRRSRKMNGPSEWMTHQTHHASRDSPPPSGESLSRSFDGSHSSPHGRDCKRGILFATPSLCGSSQSDRRRPAGRHATWCVRLARHCRASP